MKSVVLEMVRSELKARLERLARAALDAHAAATDPDSKAEGKYDTRSLEASYLAAGQARQVDELAEAVRVFEGFHPPDFAAEDAISIGALVEVVAHGESSRFLLAPAAGGMVVEVDGEETTLLTPASALFRSLVGRRAGDTVGDSGMLVIEVA